MGDESAAPRVDTAPTCETQSDRPSARRARDPVGRRDGEAPKSERRRRGYQPAGASRQSAKRSTPRSRACPRLNLDQLRLQWRNHLGGIAPAHLPGWLLMRVLAYRIQAAAFGDLDRAILRRLREPEGRRLRVGGSSSLCDPRANDPRGRRAQVGGSAGPGVERSPRAGHGPRDDGYRLEWRRLPQPFAGRQGDHRHELERTPLLRAEGGQERRRGAPNHCSTGDALEQARTVRELQR